MLLHWLAVKPTMQTTSSSAILSTVVSAFREGRATEQYVWRCAARRGNADRSSRAARMHGIWLRGSMDSGVGRSKAVCVCPSPSPLLYAHTCGDESTLSHAEGHHCCNNQHNAKCHDLQQSSSK
jgi:hypothetical protein